MSSSPQDVLKRATRQSATPAQRRFVEKVNTNIHGNKHSDPNVVGPRWAESFAARAAEGPKSEEVKEEPQET